MSFPVLHKGFGFKKNSVRQTTKGVIYKLFQKTKRTKYATIIPTPIQASLDWAQTSQSTSDTSDKTRFGGQAIYFGDYGERACLNLFSYNNKITKNTQFWLKKTKNGVQFSKTIANKAYPVIISHRNSEIFDKLLIHKESQKRFKIIFNEWLNKNGLPKIKKLNRAALLKCSIPEMAFIQDVFPDDSSVFRNDRNNYINTSIPYFHRHIKGALGFEQIIKRIFGNKSRQLKRIILASPNKFWNFCAWGHLIKKYFSPQEINNLLTELPYEVFSSHGIRTLKYLFSRLDKDYSKVIIQGVADNGNFQLLKDAATQLFQNKELVLPDEYATYSLGELHDFISRGFLKVKRENMKFNIEQFSKINGVTFGDFRLEVPKDSEQLRSYGLQMHNCIYGYDYLMKSGSSLLLGIYKNEKLTYNIDVTNDGQIKKSIRQFVTFCNAEPDAKDKKVILEKLKEFNIYDICRY